MAQYELYSSWARHQDERRWTLLSAFVIVNGLLANVVYSDQAGRLSRISIAASAIFAALVWLVILWRNEFYLRSEQDRVAAMEREMLGPTSPHLFFQDGGASNRALTNGFRKQVTSSLVTNALVVLALALWVLFLIDVVR